MGYCTQTDIANMIPEAVLIRLTDDDNAGVIDTGRLAESIDTAGDEIDTYIGGRYALPVTGTVPPILTKLCADIAIYNLYSRIKESIPELRAERYKAAVRLLEKISKGEISIGLQPPPAAPETGHSEGGMQMSARTKIFDSTTMDKY
jgi:phage gp36-like protein